MKTEVQEQIDKIKDIIVQTIPVEQVYLFGSYAYGTPNEDSDLDFYVVMKDDAPYQELDAEGILNNAVCGKKTIATDILVIKKARFDYRRSAATLSREVATRGCCSMADQMTDLDSAREWLYFAQMDLSSIVLVHATPTKLR